MAKTSLTKSDLAKEKQRLKLFLKLLPSLDLKRSQLMAEQSRANIEVVRINKAAQDAVEEFVEKLPMVANQDVNLKGLVKIKSLVIGEESIVGVKVPFLKEIIFDISQYSFLATPFWLDAYIAEIKKVIETKIRAAMMNKRAEKLKVHLRRITQHVNLFEKILIPNAKKNIQKIQILIGEAERSAVIRSKLAKALHTREQELSAGDVAS